MIFCDEKRQRVTVIPFGWAFFVALLDLWVLEMILSSLGVSFWNLLTNGTLFVSNANSPFDSWIDGTGLFAKLFHIAIFLFLQYMTAEEFTWTRREPDGSIRVRTLLRTVISPPSATIDHVPGTRGFQRIELCGTGRVALATSAFWTKARAVKIAKRMAGTLSLRLHPSLAAWVMANKHLG